MRLLVEKSSPPLIKVKKMYFIDFKIRVIMGSGSRVVASRQIFFRKALSNGQFMDNYIVLF